MIEKDPIKRLCLTKHGIKNLLSSFLHFEGKTKGQASLTIK